MTCDILPAVFCPPVFWHMVFWLWYHVRAAYFTSWSMKRILCRGIRFQHYSWLNCPTGSLHSHFLCWLKPQGSVVNLFISHIHLGFGSISLWQSIMAWQFIDDWKFPMTVAYGNTAMALQGAHCMFSSVWASRLHEVCLTLFDIREHKALLHSGYQNVCFVGVAYRDRKCRSTFDMGDDIGWRSVSRISPMIKVLHTLFSSFLICFVTVASYMITKCWFVSCWYKASLAADSIAS